MTRAHLFFQNSRFFKSVKLDCWKLWAVEGNMADLEQILRLIYEGLGYFFVLCGKSNDDSGCLFSALLIWLQPRTSTTLSYTGAWIHRHRYIAFPLFCARRSTQTAPFCIIRQSSAYVQNAYLSQPRNTQLLIWFRSLGPLWATW